MIIPEKLKKGDEIRIVSPSLNFHVLSSSIIKQATKRLENLGYKITFSQNCIEENEDIASRKEERANDLMEAFSDPNVKAILTSIGGFNSDEIIDYLDFSVIKKHPKILCGFSDITSLSNAIYKKTSLVTYSGPHYSTFGMVEEFDYILDYFNKCLVETNPIIIEDSIRWSDNSWFNGNQENRQFHPNPGTTIIQKGFAKGTIIGGNLRTLCKICDTEYMPDLTNVILFLEDEDIYGHNFVLELLTNLQTLMKLDTFSKIKGLVIGRCNIDYNIMVSSLTAIVNTFEELQQIPVLYGADFGHTSPIFTFPIGGTTQINAVNTIPEIAILNH